MTTLAVMAAGILAGRVFPAGQKSNNERLQLLCTAGKYLRRDIGRRALAAMH